MTKKERIIKLIIDSNEEYWENNPNRLPKITDKQRNEIDEMNTKLADDIINLLDEEE